MAEPHASQQPAAERSWLNRLVGNIMLLGAAFALTGLVFYLFWYWQGDTTAPQDSYQSSSERKKSDPRPATDVDSSHSSAETTTAGTSEQRAEQDSAASQNAASQTMELLLQGPEAGKLVAPPGRNVTPGYALSPYYQAAPLVRESGSPLPPAPEPDPLPEIFRRVSVLSPSRLSLVVSKFRDVDVNLAHLKPVNADEDCWMSGRTAKCTTLGASALSRFIRFRSVRCDWVGADGSSNDEKARNGSNAATCYLGPGINQFKPGEEPVNVTDLASWVVRFGWAEPEEGFYQDEMFEAKEAKRGRFATEATESGDDIMVRQQETDEVSSMLRSQSDALAPISSPELLKDANSGALSIMTPPSDKVVEKKELPLPPGFEMIQ